MLIGADYDDAQTPNHLIFGQRLESSCEVNEEKISENNNNNTVFIKRK